MAANAYTDADDLPRELQVDLLVDGELPEARRRTLLASLDQEPGQWRTVALRFLQQQTEKESVRALMAGGRVVPEAVAIAPARDRRAVIGRVGWQWMSAVAAGLLIAAISATITLLVVRPPGGATAGPVAEFKMALPGDLVASDRAIPVSVPMVRAADSATIFPTSNEMRNPGKTTVVVQPDGNGGYMVIPVNMSKATIY